MAEPLALRTFTAADQEQFARASGDRNPMHLDPIAARRTQAGAPVVHGIHLLLWALDTFAGTTADPAPVGSLRVRFNQFLYVGEPATLHLIRLQSDEVHLSVTADQAPVATIRIRYGQPCSDPVDLQAFSTELTYSGAALDIPLEQMDGRSGRVPFLAPGLLVDMFGQAAAWIGPARVAALAAATYLVGMICPGLHSIFTELSIQMHGQPGTADALAFRVIETDARFRTVVQEIKGGGLTGTITCFVRHSPVQQPAVKDLAGLVLPYEFSNSVALVVGASRGLGELTAKLISAGGGKVVLTFQRGAEDAGRIAEEIRLSGGACQPMHFDASISPREQLAGLGDSPTHLYYFATPPIFRPRRQLFNRSRLFEFLAVYVDGFWNLVQALSLQRPDLSVFYPSSVALDARPPGITEYAMAKAAGETLCADINAAMAPLHVTVSRLPRLSTDQTAQVMADDTELPSAVEILLPLVRETQSWPKPERTSAQTRAGE